MKTTFKLEDQKSIDDITAVLVSVIALNDKPHVVEIKPASTVRTVLQNSLSHAWYREVELKEKEYTASMIKCLCKLHFGLNINRGDDADYNAKCVKYIDPLPYEDKVESMEFFPVTSFFNTRQFNDYLKAVRLHYSGRVDLRFSDECPLIEYKEAQ